MDGLPPVPQLASPRPFRFGVVAGSPRSGSAWTDAARRIEGLGYATLLVPDTLAYTLSPFPALAAAAAVTSTLRLGTYVLSNDLRHPVQVARDVVTLGLLSSGRAELGLGAGRPGSEREHRMLGQTFDAGPVRVQRLADALDIVSRLLGGETVTTTVGAYRVEEASLAPGPVQRPRPPILVAGAAPPLLDLAGRQADIVSIGLPPDASFETLAERVGRIRAAASPRQALPELNLNVVAAGDAIPEYLRRQLGLSPAELRRRGAVAVLPESVDGMCERLVELRERLGVSYFSVAEELAEPLAPVVARLAGR